MLEHQYPHLSNEELLGKYKAADGLAFEEFFRRNQRVVYNFLLARLRNRADADEAFQKTFFKLHRYIASYDPKQSAVGWMLTIARNVANDVMAQRVADASAQTEIPLVHNDVAALEAREILRQIVASLTDDERRLLEKRFLEDTSYEEISFETGASIDTVRHRVSRLLRRLKQRIPGQHWS